MTMTRSRILIFSLFSCCFLHQLLPAADGSRVSITSNGYSDIVVAISPNVPQNLAGSLLRNIQVEAYMHMITVH